jgi:hypothetical protein
MDHPLRAVLAVTGETLNSMSPLIHVMYAEVGRPSIPPKKLLRAQLLQMLYSVRSERLLMEEIDYSNLYRWFVWLNLDERVWDATSFTIAATVCWKRGRDHKFSGASDRAGARNGFPNERYTVRCTLHHTFGTGDPMLACAESRRSSMGMESDACS